MRYFNSKLFRTGIIGAFAVFILFGCASVKEMNVGQKYEASKSWLKEKWNAMGSKSSSSKDGQLSLKPYDQNPNYLVYESQWSYETLSGIAEWFTGAANNWEKLSAVNPRVRPNHIDAGTLILIPVKLAKNRKFPTEAFANKNRPDYFKHKVQWSGETLSLIAKWYTGRFGNWKALAKENPGLNPNRIGVGNIINIPTEMLNSKEPLPHKVVAKSLSGYYAHTVREPDEKLTDIASWYTGKAGNAKLLAKANPDIDPEFLLVGNEIFIPSDLLKTRKPLNQKSIQASTSKTVKKPSVSKNPAPAPPADKPKKMQLFGPKKFPAN
jgi:hypothetical protein